MITRALQSSRTKKVLLEDMKQVAQSLGVSVANIISMAASRCLNIRIGGVSFLW
jgi:hypothetical protein